MLKSYFKIAWRGFVKDRQFTLLNLIDLCTGLACALLIYIWVADELQVDKFHEKDACLFQVMENRYSSPVYGRPLPAQALWPKPWPKTWPKWSMP